MAQQVARERRAWREAPTAEALAFDRWRLGAALGGEPGELRAVRPGAFLFFDVPSPMRFLGVDGQPLPGSITDDGIAILTVSGPLEHHASWWASYDDIAREVEIALKWEATRALVLKIDSPGGVVAGMGQAHRAIRRLQKETGKRAIAWVDETACSAAYNVASACSEIWMPPEAQVGSIGVILCTIDETKRLEKEGVAVRYLVSGARKADMHPGAPLTDDVLKAAQAKVDELAAGFFSAVGRARKMKPRDVAGLEAAVFMGERAVDVGLADGVSDWPGFLGALRDTIGASVGTSGARGTLPAAKAKVTEMSMTRIQAAAAKTTAEMAVASAQKAYDKSPTLANLDALNARKAELAKVIHHMKHEEKTVQLDSERPGEPSSQGPDTAPSAAAGSEEPDSEEPESVESEDAKKAKKAKKPAAPMKGEDGDAEEKKAAAAFAAAERRYLRDAREAGVDAYGVHGPGALLKACQKLTGETEIARVFGALAGLRSKLEEATKLERDVRDLKAKRAADEIEALVAQAKADGKATSKTQRAELRGIGKKHGISALTAAIKVLPVSARTSAHEAREDGNALGAFGGSDAQRDAEIEAAALAFSADPKERESFKAKLRENIKATAAKIPAA